MATIKPIEGRSVHQIQSGQVIVDLQSVCKELVENGIDAGATSIEVRFKNSGLDAIEVQDNGSGIAPDDYETIALKHYTSKLAVYDDLSSLQTFGFRGEALSSLCALSKFHIVTTRPEDGPKGTKLEFEHSGKLKGTSVVAAKQGTTVSVESLFFNLPVRRKELEKNVKREYNKVLQLLNSYACISVGVKFSVSNQIPKGKKTIAFSTNANPSTRENISNVYGAKTASALIALDLEFALDTSSRPAGTQSIRLLDGQADAGSSTVKIVGHVSRPVVGEGRQTPDRQMFFVNSRPCNLPQVAKAFNEVYKSFNITQSPFVFADIKLDTNAYDVNVSPDKRTILLHDQAALLENLKESLLELFEQHDQTVPQSQLGGQKPLTSAFKPPSLQHRNSVVTAVADASHEPVSRREVLSSSSEVDASSPLAKNSEGPHIGFVKASLIERFAGRNAEERPSDPPLEQRRRNSPPEVVETQEAEPPSHGRGRRTSLVSLNVSQPDQQRPQSLLLEPEVVDHQSPRRLSPSSRILQDFNARIASEHARHIERDRSMQSLGPTEEQESEEEQESIPAIKQTPQKHLTQSSIQNAFDRMRPMRTPAQQATITVGGTTTVSLIGESASSRQSRIHTPKFSSSGKPLNQTPKRSLFGKGLSGFAAPGTQMIGDHAEEEQDEIESDEDSSMPDAPARSPSPQKNQPLELAKGKTSVGDETLSDEDLGSASESEPEAILVEAESSDDEYVDETEKRAREEAMIAQMIDEAEEAAASTTEQNLKRANKMFKVTQKKYWTVNVRGVIDTDASSIMHLIRMAQAYEDTSNASRNHTVDTPTATQPNPEDPEERLSLTVTKQDFTSMAIIGQFNLGFIIAVRPPTTTSPTTTSPTSELFIIDQHASDEKYNFERLSATTTLVSQRLVHPHPLELTAVEEEIILANEHALTANGFIVTIDSNKNDADADTGNNRRARLTSLPMSKEVTFTPTDLEELLALILDDPPSFSTSTSPHIPRPSKVRKLLASRACRSSVMIGKTLQHARMREIVRHMGSMDKPWSCPHGRPTMRHLYSLEKWQGWKEGDGVVGVDALGEKADWAGFLRKSKR